MGEIVLGHFWREAVAGKIAIKPGFTSISCTYRQLVAFEQF
jgi:hypothetical protein